jgi:hypothetical protein
MNTFDTPHRDSFQPSTRRQAGLRGFVTALRHSLSRIGVGLTTACALLFLFLLLIRSIGLLDNPYSGILVFILVPAFFVIGLLLIPIGRWLERWRSAPGVAAPEWPRLDLNNPAIRRAVFLVVAATFVNLAIVSIASYGTVQYTESQAFCGQVCPHGDGTRVHGARWAHTAACTASRVMWVPERADS